MQKKSSSNTQKSKKQLKERLKSLEEDVPSVSLNDVDALDGHATISSWEEDNGRGFWGNADTGYIYDKDM